MNKRKMWYKKSIACVLALLIACSALLGNTAVNKLSANAASISSLESKKSAIKQQRDEISAKINSLEFEQMTTLAQKEVLDEQVMLTQNEIAAITEQIEEYKVLIKEKQAEVAEARERENAQWELYLERIRSMEEQGVISYFEILFGASSFSDFLSRVDFVSEVIQYDEVIYQNYVDARNATIAAQVKLTEAKHEQEMKKVELDAAEAELEEQVAEAAAVLAKLENDIAASEALYAQLREEENRIQNQINELVASQNAANNSSSGGSSSGGSSSGGSVVGTGSLMWPATSKLVTSQFGGRNAPTAGASTNHKGIDIGAGYGTKVSAADSGTVIMAQYNGGYGNCVVINHGNGMTTLYGHMSQINVSVGQSVSKGDSVGLVGSTGVSSGPHLHFEVSVNGSRVNPLNYFTGYTIW